ncbi:hypothetical protein OS493_040001 [Desmophyllum pertusum]|uniref:Uncharacterized protein n=1 Tax=Desmophyllum pertusum TaxID=174260 RepID=A0A9X0CU36_9CNID|nr:hypothetical protein OS493_040001 [Desmophyllum pertusum]
MTKHQEDTAGPVDRPKICINEPEDSTGEQAKENQHLIENRRSSNTELAAEKKERRGGTGRTTSDEKFADWKGEIVSSNGVRLQSGDTLLVTYSLLRSGR